MLLLGCAGIFLVLAVVAGEVYSFVVASDLLRQHARDLIGGSAVLDTILPIILIQAVLMGVGVLVVKQTFSRLPLVMMGSIMGQNNDGGRIMLTMIGGILLIVPGFFLDLLAFVLLFPLTQYLFARLGQRVMMSVVRRQMGKMFPGGMPRGGMSGFPGMQPRQPMTPDERIPRGLGKVIDTTAERVDR